MMAALGGMGERVEAKDELRVALVHAIRAAQEGRPSLIDVVLSPLAGHESGNVHTFNHARL